MNRSLKHLAGCAMVMMAGAVMAGDIVINEFMAANNATLLDANGQSSDWLELYNTKSSRSGATNLDGWYLTNDPNDLKKWRFPSTPFNGNTYKLVFCSGGTNDLVGGQLHANFNLRRNGDYLALVEPDGATISDEYTPEFPEQYTDVSFGRDPGGNDAYFATPTPGATNLSGYAANGPVIETVGHSPDQPGDADNIVVTAAISHAAVGGVATAQLHYVVMFGAEVDLQMFDDGAHGDGLAGDGVFGATIPAAASLPGNMVRYAVSAVGADGSYSR
ncbi:MAG: lamin tail domain-containing protein, partial [Verrucomicrobia bacterium]|nr:lamin tail domain-containing protein [Verrucomicrobiota bacterium]